MTPDNQLQYTEPDSDLIDPIDYSQYPVYESNCSYDEYYQPCEDEIEAVLGHHNQLEDETEYQTAWNGMIRWFSESQLADCYDILEEYRAIALNVDSTVGVHVAATDTVMDPTGVRKVDRVAASAEVSWDEWLSPANIEKATAAMQKEKDAVISARLVPVDPSTISNSMRKQAGLARYVNTFKRCGTAKSRIVLTEPGKGGIPIKDTYAPVPDLSTFRLICASTDLLLLHDAATTDFVTAFLQAKGYEAQGWYLIKLWCPITSKWEYYWCTGPLYGGSDAPKLW